MNSRGELPGRWAWITLVVVLGALAVVRVLAEKGTAWPAMDQIVLAHARWAVGLAVALASAMLIMVARVGTVVGVRRGMDRAFMILVLSWVISSAGVATMGLYRGDATAILFRHLAYQFSVGCTLNFLCSTVGRRVPLPRSLALMQFLVAVGLLAWGYAFAGHREWTVAAWRITNVLGFTLVMLTLCHELVARAPHAPWLSLGGCLMGFGLGLSDMASVDGSAVPVSAVHNVFAAYLLMLWLLLTHRLGDHVGLRRGVLGHSENSILGAAFAHTDLNGAPMPDALTTELAETVAARRRIAQELHDGVGSQLVSMLASLDRNEPQQSSMAEALEQCLLDVKILVDDIDSAQESVVDALARLRYRVQASLDRLGIRLRWDLQDDPHLHLLRGDIGRQMLRVAQESLANVMRHSQARHVTLSCRYLADGNEVVLEITDDGHGFDSRHLPVHRGKGLQGMHRRAENIRANLQIRSQPGKGANIRLSVPMQLHSFDVDSESPVRSSLLP